MPLLRLQSYLRHSITSPVPMLERRAPEATVKRLRGGVLMTMRRRLLARSGGRCECPQCRSGHAVAITWDTFEIDHIQRIADGGTNAIENLRALHVQCHERITRRQLSEIAMYSCVLDEPAPPPRTSTRADEDEMPC